jgi:hypothetical protein
MSYPFAKMPTMREFVTMAIESHGCTVGHYPCQINGQQVNVEYLERKKDGKFFRTPIKDYNGNPLNPSVLDWYCRSLNLDATVFGLHLNQPAQLNQPISPQSIPPSDFGKSI